jgi:hypothetical protein
MAIMWFAKDGKRPHTQSDPGIDISLGEIHAIFGKESLRYVGTEPPSINPDAPSHSEKNVVLEIDTDDGASDLLPQYGFYLVVGVRPEDAKARLHIHRQST